jgi:formylglycine-generating enzyme required for sulfatase activity
MAEPTRVLISYSHDSPAHAAAVLALANALRAAGIDAHIDQYDPFPKVGWPAWMREKLAWAQKIIAVCTPTYKQRFEQHNPAGVGLGASWEGLLAELTIYGDRDRRGDFVPVLLAGASPDAIPTLLRGLTFHQHPAPLEVLLRHLLDRPKAEFPPLGPLPTFAAQSPGLAAAPTVDDRADALNHAIAAAHAAGDPARADALRDELKSLHLPSRGSLKAGDVLGDRYHLSRVLGVGGFSTVWAAVEPLGERRVREVAVKVLHTHQTDGRSARARLKKATADHAALHDGGVVRIFHPWCEDPHRCWIVMELVTGGDLHRAVVDGQIPPRAAVRLCLAVGRTLARLHAEQVIHADVKPSNILLDPVRGALLADFDLAKNLKISRLGRTQRIGDALFSCLEQRSQKPVDYLWDVYGISVTALWCASGGTLDEEQVTYAEYPDLPLPAPVLAVLKRGAAPRQAHRTPDMATWCRDLKAALAAKPTPAKPLKASKQALRRLVAASRAWPASKAAAAPKIVMPPNTGSTAPPTKNAASEPSAATPRPTPNGDLRRRLASSAIAPPADLNDPATLTPGVRRTLLLPGDVPLELAWIPAGKFWMGSPDGFGRDNERPRHPVTLTPPYWLGVNPVTQAQWAAIATTLPTLNATPSYFKGADRPVEQVSWDDARAWCNALSACLGLRPAYPNLTDPDAINWTTGARLPTEAEWERACRAGTGTAWSFGDDRASLADHAWFDKGWNEGTHPVGRLRPNPWGLHDLHGNVWEWCWDAALRDYTAKPVVDPRHPPSANGDRCARGGSFAASASGCRSACRNGRGPSRRHRYLGLRVVVPADQEPTAPSASAVPSIVIQSRLPPSTPLRPAAEPSDPEPNQPGARRTLLLPGDVPLDLAWIPAGTFRMGSPDRVGEDRERPRHHVTLTRSYWIGITPVTQAQWAAVAATVPTLNVTPSHHKGADRPVEQVSWDNARAWCNALSAYLGLSAAYPKLSDRLAVDWTIGVRLPTESEWERACRAGTDTAYSFGERAPNLADHAWFDANSDNETQRVGRKAPNPWGLLDLHGNVSEWCWDGWNRTYSGAPVTDPVHPGSSNGYRCVRGGSYLSFASVCRSAYRYFGDPTTRRLSLGLRIVLPYRAMP